MPILEEKTRPEVRAQIIPAPTTTGSGPKQRRQMLVALALLLAALILVLYKDWQYFFPGSPSAETETTDQATPPSTVKSRPQAPAPAAPAPVSKPKQRAAASAPAQPAASEDSGLSPVVTKRAVLPPLEVEVVAGNQRRALQPTNNAVKVEVQPGSSILPGSVAQVEATPSAVGAAANASERVVLSPGTAEVLSRPVEPNYPMLAKQSKVQGSVILQALIGKDGNIQDLRVLSGPAILSTAAQEAVKQWKFKPYYQEGLAVETEARITVHFTISTN